MTAARRRYIISIKKSIFALDKNNHEKQHFKTMRTLYKTEATPGDWLQDITGLYEITEATADGGAIVKEVFFIDPENLTSTNNYYLGKDEYILTAWQIRHLYKVNI